LAPISLDYTVSQPDIFLRENPLVAHPGFAQPTYDVRTYVDVEVLTTLYDMSMVSGPHKYIPVRMYVRSPSFTKRGPNPVL
jgi:hypothetical protein